MKRILGLAVLALSACQPAVETSTNAVPVVVPQGQIGALLNSERAAQGLGALSEDVNLSRAAQAHAQDMVTQGYFSHEGRNGSSFVQRAQAAGYPCVAAENIANGQLSEAAVMTGWMNSSGHRRNILLPDATEFGIGRVNNMWVLMLGRGC
ncbi:CAP domain-containing protein [Octadecabacter sp. G9-8]|uniref:CAP domain-containing protein n=1 Tax=Octadecabacter dasysiphoniae TaxID=2909341 RepID=A0ABS9CUY8_9RHOB|nr:CAP domain-containing protein [Octadecabacter dasysiphoniae]MCF2870001.1 CAP domain-containing protein [Octadecabacter dasysiphoniae]